MKKTIASVALLVSTTSAFALIGPGGGRPVPKPKNYCLSLYENEQNVAYLGDCDNTERNARYGLELKENGCAEGQASLQSVRVKIPSCPTFVQL